MSKMLIVYSTFPDVDEASSCARTLVEERLCACANILGQITSIYHWQGEIVDDEEIAVIFKTTEKLYKKLEKRLKELHSYETPCIIAYPVTKGSKDYLQWLDDSVK